MQVYHISLKKCILMNIIDILTIIIYLAIYEHKNKSIIIKFTIPKHNKHCMHANLNQSQIDL